MSISPKSKFGLIWILYLLSVLIAFILTFTDLPIFKLHLGPGLVIGSLFPFISLLYFYRHYIRESEATFPSIFNWFLPAFFIHIIIIFGFIITLDKGPGSKTPIPRYIYTSFYDYGRIFKSFQNVEGPIKGDIIGYIKKDGLDKDEFNTLSSYYTPYFRVIKITDQGEVLKGFAELTGEINQIPFFIAFAFGFLGVLIFCLRDAIIRFNSDDLYPKTYVFYIVRFIVSATLAVTLAYFIMDDWPTVIAPLVFFLIGYFPDRAITYLDQKVTRFLGIKTTKYKPIPLSMIQGLTDYKVFRLREIGVADAQNLAVANIEHLESNIPFGKTMICDWIAQSILLLHFPDNIESLRHLGIRTILDFKQCFLDKQKEVIETFADKSGLEVAQLESLLNILKLKHVKARMAELEQCMQ
jgi:hypothetical protein